MTRTRRTTRCGVCATCLRPSDRKACLVLAAQREKEGKGPIKRRWSKRPTPMADEGAAVALERQQRKRSTAARQPLDAGVVTTGWQQQQHQQQQQQQHQQHADGAEEGQEGALAGGGQRYATAWSASLAFRGRADVVSARLQLLGARSISWRAASVCLEVTLPCGKAPACACLPAACAALEAGSPVFTNLWQARRQHISNLVLLLRQATAARDWPRMAALVAVLLASDVSPGWEAGWGQGHARATLLRRVAWRGGQAACPAVFRTCLPPCRRPVLLTTSLQAAPHPLCAARRERERAVAVPAPRVGGAPGGGSGGGMAAAAAAPGVAELRADAALPAAVGGLPGGWTRLFFAWLDP